MKKLAMMVLAIAMGMTTLYAQNFQTEEPLIDGNQAAVAEFVDLTLDMPTEASPIVDASFPTENDIYLLTEQLTSNPDRIAAAILAILLGDFGIQHFYTGQTLRGILDILFCWTGIPAIIGLVEGIIWLCDDEASWAERVAKWNS